MLGTPHHVFIDSDYAQSGTHSNFNYKIALPKEEKYNRVALLQANLPKSYYTVKDGKNSMILEENGTQYTFTIDPANYSASLFATILSQKLSSASHNSVSYTVALPTRNQPQTGKFSFYASSIATNPKIIFPASSDLHIQCGFNYNSTNTFTTQQIYSTNVVNFNDVIGLIIKTDMIASAGNSDQHGNAVLQEIYCFNTTDYSNVGFQNTSIEFSAKPLKDSDIEYASFIITDLDDNLIEFNGHSVNFSLVFFKKDDYHDMAKSDLTQKWFKDVVENLQNINVNTSSDTTKTDINSSQPSKYLPKTDIPDNQFFANTSF